jgi:L-lactate dehydrogenase (cytochrome)
VGDVLRLLRSQLAADLRGLPSRLRPGSAAARRLAAAGSIAELRAAARRALPKVIFDFVEGGAGDEVTLRRNVEDLAAIELVPQVLVDVSDVDISTEVLGRRIALPVIGAPTGLCGLVHPEGELALARALHDAGSIYTLAAMSSYSIEEVARGTSGPLWFQTYIWRDRGLVVELLDRAREAGYGTLVVTVDVPCAAVRDRDRRNGFGIPPRLTVRSALDGLARPGWTYGFLRHQRIAAANVARRAPAGGTDPVNVAAYVNEQFDPRVDWRALEWLRQAWDGPFVVKGLLSADDAVRAVATGADGVVVSNHGGRQLDHAPSTIGVLPEIVDAVGDRAEVYLDGGIRRGPDIAKALALGARAVLVGRPIVFGLGAGGRAGAARALAILADELRATLALLGCPAVSALGRGHVRDRHAHDVAAV